MKHRYDFKIIFSSFVAHLWCFIKRLSVFLFSFGQFAIISYGIAILVPVLLRDYLGLDRNICSSIIKVLLTIAPLLPTLACTYLYDQENTDEFSMDMCFVTWIVTIVWAWAFL